MLSVVNVLWKLKDFQVLVYKWEIKETNLKRNVKPRAYTFHAKCMKGNFGEGINYRL